MATTVTVAAAMERFLRESRLAPATRATYGYGLARLGRFLEEAGLPPATTPVGLLTVEVLTGFASAIVPEDVRTPEQVSAMRTAQVHLSAMRKFATYLMAYDLHPGLSADRLRVRVGALMPRFTPPPPEVRLEDLERVLAYVRAEQPATTAIRALRQLKVRAMVLTLARTGVRVSELCALRRKDLDLVHGTARVYRAKGGKSRTVHFDAETARALAAYFAARRDPGHGVGALPVFSGRDVVGEAGAAINRRTVELIVAELGREAGAEGPVGPHSFRHGLATELVRRRVRESTVQTILGHASPATTRIYVHQSAVDIADDYQSAFGAYAAPEAC